MSAPLPKEMNFRDRLESAGVGVRNKLFIQPTNGATFTSSENFSEFVIPGNRANTFADLKNLYLRISMTTAIDAIFLDRAGVLNCVERIECDTSSGVRIFETRNKDVIDNLKLYEESDVYSLEGGSRELMGTSSNSTIDGADAQPGSPERVETSSVTNRVFILPIVNTPINGFVPMFGNDGIRFRIHWASALNFVIENTTTDVAANSFTFTSVRMYYDTVKLSDADMGEMLNETDGRFVITGNAYDNQQETSVASSLTMNLGFGRTKCKRIYVALRNTAALASKVSSSHSFDIHDLNTAELRYNGHLINESSLTFTAGNAAVVLAEIVKQSGKSIMGCRNMLSRSTFQTARPTVAYNADSGTFHIVFDLTSGADTHLSESGLDTRTGSFQLNLIADSVLAHNIDVFCEYETKIVLDMRADRVFRVMS